MSTVSNGVVRNCALVAATVIALSALSAPAFAGRIDLNGLNAAQGYDGFIVKYRSGSAPRRNSSAVSAALRHSLRSKIAGRLLALRHVRRLAIGSDFVRAEQSLDRVAAEALMRQLASDPDVESVQINRLWTHTMVPNDPRYNQQWHYFGANGARVDTAWDRASGVGAIVAVVDTGITPQAELNAGNNLLPGYDFISSELRSRDGDARDNNPNDEGDWSAAGECDLLAEARNSSWHGTHVAGTIAAATNNAAGVAGVAHGARIVPVRVLGKCGGTTIDIADAIVWAAGGAVNGVPANPNPAEVINLSLGGPNENGCDAAYQEAINIAVARRATVVVAAGNSNLNVSHFSPANCDNVIAVAATDQNGDRAFYSNYGAMLDLAAPGGENCSPANRFLRLDQSPVRTCVNNHDEQGVLSLGNAGLRQQAEATYTFMSGTSMAAPHVAGVAALMQSAVARPLTPAQIEQALKDSSRPIAAENCPGGCGAGLLDANAAVLEAVRIGGGVNGNVAPVANFTIQVAGLTASFTDDSTDLDGGIAARSWNFGDGSATSTAANPSHTYAVAGTYNVSLTVTDDAGGAHTKTTSVTVAAADSGPQSYSNATDYAIKDYLTVESPIAVTGRSGLAPSNAKLTLAIEHSFRGDLRIDLVAPDGSTYLVKNYNINDSANDVRTTTTLNLSSETLNGIWKLRVRDNYLNDVGNIDSWSIEF